MRILFVDDDDVTLFLYKRLVKGKTGLEVHYAKNGSDALDWIVEAENPFDAIFLDINMPVMDGFEFLKNHQKLHPKQKSKNIFLMLGTDISAENMSTSIDTGVVEFVNKPLREDRFNSLLASILR